MTNPSTERAAIVAWLRDPNAQDEIINLTFAMRNSDVIHALNKAAWIIERGNHLAANLLNLQGRDG